MLILLLNNFFIFNFLYSFLNFKKKYISNYLLFFNKVVILNFNNKFFYKFKKFFFLGALTAPIDDAASETNSLTAGFFDKKFTFSKITIVLESVNFRVSFKVGVFFEQFWCKEMSCHQLLPLVCLSVMIREEQQGGLRNYGISEVVR
ncbi:hypothetical protein [Candidatus Nasuia deltocephalinicola]|uniref:hypothetical protein n=1 Tax=Candidatus Nasuia deltocephalincola TaxID=1160784 RepID=UPI00216B2114|nr:hypothetical protein [Candidatus Nasuia deltocephalinicola]